jgi:ATP-dependent Clp protease ATP-binding subunit ClpC
MNIQFTQYKKLHSLLASFYPNQNVDKKELNKKDSGELINYVITIIDTLIKGENYHKNKNVMLPNGRSFFTENRVEVLSNINLYLYRFETKILNLTKSERQTLIFIIENVIDYLKSSSTFDGQKDKGTLFMDYRFWIENFFKMFNQKIDGTIYSSKKVNLKSFFNTDDSSKNQLVFSNATVSFNLSPFLLVKGNQNLFLQGITDKSLVYKNEETGKKVLIRNKQYDAEVFEFMVYNLNFRNALPVKTRLKSSQNILVEVFELLADAQEIYRNNQYQQSHDILQKVPLDKVKIPLVNLIHIKNLVHLNRTFEVKQLIQKFLLLYPYYYEIYEIMGDIYQKEGNLELAKNYYEKVLLITQKKEVSEKLKKVKDSFAKNKSKPHQQQNNYFYDLTESVLSQDEEIILREKELQQIVEILISNRRRNVLLVGESGVGKTALIKLLAQKMLNGDLPDILNNKRLKEINFVALLTGSKYRGQFEEKSLKLLNEFKLQPAILILEDIHLMMSTGTARGTSLDLVNILKQFLRENSIQVIATTNYEEFKNTIAKDNALMGFFQKLMVNELQSEDNKTILKNLAKKILEKEKILVSEDIIDDMVEIAKRDIRGKKLPDSAIMIFERAVAKLKYKLFSGEPDKFKIESSDIQEVLSDLLNLPDSNISVSMKNRLLDLRNNVLKQIIGQDASIERIVANIVTSKLDFEIKKNRPDGIFLLIGPTGVGKTETAIALTKALYGSDDYLIRIDMSEYMERFTYSRFIGAAPGYVGYMDTNQLTDKVRQNPFSIILLDEIEKADSQLINIFLQVFDAGRLTDARGNIVDFSHTTFIMTSNIGTSLFSKIEMGYQSDLTGTNVSHSALLKSLKKHFSPEFLNRVDEIVVFNHLEKEHIKKIIGLQLTNTREHLKKLQKELIIKDEVIDFIIKTGYSKEYGARNIARVLRKHLLEKIAHCSLTKEWNSTKQVICSMNKEDISIKLELEEIEPMDNSKLMEDVVLK